MTYFKINVADVKENIDSFDLRLRTYMDNLDNVYDCIKNTDSSWNDKNSYSFMSIANDDRIKIDKYLIGLKQYYNQIDIFVNNLSDVFSTYGYNGNLNIFYNDEFLNEIISELDASISNLNSAIYYLNQSVFTMNLSCFYEIKNLKYSLYNIKNKISTIVFNINDLNKKVLLELERSKKQIGKIDKVDLNIDKMEYIWSTTENSLVVNKFDTDIKYESYNLNNKISDLKQNYDYDVSSDVNRYSTGSSKINVEKGKVIEDVSQNIKTYGTVKNNNFDYIDISNELNIKPDTVNVKETSINKSFGKFDNEVPNVSSYDVKSQNINTNVNSSVDLDSYQTFESISDIGMLRK